jgi:hypothetical protein
MGTGVGAGVGSVGVTRGGRDDHTDEGVVIKTGESVVVSGIRPKLSWVTAKLPIQAERIGAFSNNVSGSSTENLNVSAKSSLGPD